MKTSRTFKIPYVLSFFIMISAAILSCGGGGGGGGGTSSSGGCTTIPANAKVFKTFSYVDTNGIGTEAFHMLIPTDWTVSGGINWRFDNPGAPAVASFSVKAPNGKAELQLLPAQSFFSTQDQSVLLVFPIGSKYYGNEVRPYPALGPVETLEQLIVPRNRANVTDLQIVSKETLTDVALLLRAGLPPQSTTTIEAAKIRIEYTENGTQMEEEIYCILESDTFITFIYNNTLWMADYLFSFRAEKGKLDSQYKVFESMMYSFRLNPQWFNKYVQLIDYLVQQQIQVIQSWGQISQIISQTSDDISDMVWDSYNSRSAANDRMGENFSDYLIGTDTYVNPADQSTVKLPSGYGDAWANSLGDYILIDDANYDPNVGSNLSWQRLNIQ